eukprot:15089846-Alexandrium_andersonii.AAC.1
MAIPGRAALVMAAVASCPQLLGVAQTAVQYAHASGAVAAVRGWRAARADVLARQGTLRPPAPAPAARPPVPASA